MATNRDLLKEAIADAKAVKEMAIANAKSALEEAFTPRIKEMFSAKLNEMDSEELEEMEDEMKEGYGEKMDEMKDETMEEAGFGKSMADSDEGFSSGMDEKALDEEMDLEELLAELEKEESMEESLNEAEEEEETEEVESEEEVEGEGEPLDLEDMTDEDLKKMIEDVIADMIEAGELEAGEGAEGEEEEESEEGEEMEMSDEEEEVDLAELLREIEEDEVNEEKEEIEEEKEPLDESAVMELVQQFLAQDPAIMGDALKGILMGLPVAGFGAMFVNALRGASKEKKEKVKDAAIEAGADTESSDTVSSELDEAYSTIESLRKDLNEVNLLNAKLLYSNKIFKSKNLNESQKVKVLSSFDKASTVGEVKMVFETLNEGLKVKNTIKESRGIASKATTLPNTKRPIVEANDTFTRMQQLAFYKSQH